MMTSGEDYVLQVTPKRIEFNDSSLYAKVDTSLTFGSLEFKSPYTRFIRNNSRVFYGERLQLTNKLDQQAYLKIQGTDHAGTQSLIANVKINCAQIARRDQITWAQQEGDNFKFQYEVKVEEKEIFEDYEEVTLEQPSITIDSRPILSQLTTNQLQQQNTQVRLDQGLEGVINSVETPKLDKDISLPAPDYEELFQESPINRNSQFEASQNRPQTFSESGNNFFQPREIDRPKANQQTMAATNQQPLATDQPQLPVEYIPVHKEPLLLSLITYTTFSLFAFYMGVCVKLYVSQQ